MATITDFEAWLGEVDPEGHEEVHALYSAVVNVEAHGMYTCKASANGEKWFVSADSADDKLMLASPKARDAFLSLLQARYCDEGMSMEVWYTYRRAMEKDD